MTWTPGAVRVRAPLKLVLAGEYAVLDPGSTGVSAAIDRYVSCTARRAQEGVTLAGHGVSSAPARARGPQPDGALELEFASEEDARRLRFVRLATELAYRYVAEIGLPVRPLAIECESEAGLLRLAPSPAGAADAPGGGAAGGGIVKIGLGTSAAATVATAGAVLAAHGVAIDRPTFRRALFRLALVAHSRAQGDRGSGIDVAASAHGGIIEYARADLRWLRRMESQGASPLELARGPWPGQHVEGIAPPRDLRILAGFTGTGSSTADLVAVVERWKRERQGEHETFVRLSQRAARGLALALRKGDRAEVIQSMSLARKALLYLGERTGLPIETPGLEKLTEIAREAGGAAKLSGAGGGDCGVALAFDDATVERIEEGWREGGIIPIRVSIAPRGVREERLDE